MDFCFIQFKMHAELINTAIKRRITLQIDPVMLFLYSISRRCVWKSSYSAQGFWIYWAKGGGGGPAVIDGGMRRCRPWKDVSAGKNVWLAPERHHWLQVIHSKQKTRAKPTHLSYLTFPYRGWTPLSQQRNLGWVGVLFSLFMPGCACMYVFGSFVSLESFCLNMRELLSSAPAVLLIRPL